MIGSVAELRLVIQDYLSGDLALDDLQAQLTWLGEALPGLRNASLEKAYGASERALAEYELGHIDEIDFVARLRSLAPTVVWMEPRRGRIITATTSQTPTFNPPVAGFVLGPSPDAGTRYEVVLA
jgi:hypothetical protein